MQFFQTNLDALKVQNADIAMQLSNISEVHDFEIFMDESDASTLNFVHKKHFTPLYTSSAKDEFLNALALFETLKKHPYLYIYGLGNGVLIAHLLNNSLRQRVVVIEPELEIIYVVLHMFDFSEAITSGRLILVGAREITFPIARTFFNLTKEQRYAKIYDLHINTSYYQTRYSENIINTNRAFIEAIYHAINGAGNDAKDALIGLKHHIFNLQKLFETPPLIDMLNKLNTTDTAVLVSTGPSLTKQLPLLKKIAPFVRIIAVDASFPVLYNSGIRPDVVVSMERVKESARFFEQVPIDGYDDVMIALSSLQHQDVIKSIKGGTMQMSLRPLGYMIATGPKEWGYMGIGSSAANMGYELIFYSGFKNCILIGQDLAYSEDGKSHASGHVFGENDVQTKGTDVWVEGWGGEKKVRTNHTWTMFRNFFEKDIGDIKDAMLSINATEGGARIHGTKELEFAKAIEQYVGNKEKAILQLKKMPSQQLAEKIETVEQKIDEIVIYVTHLLEATKELFLDAAKESEKDISEITHESLEELIARIEKIKSRQNEEIYDQVVWHIAQSMMLVQEIELAPIEVYIAQNGTLEKERLMHLVQGYKGWLFSFAGIMDAILKTIAYAKARRLIDQIETIDVYVGSEKIDTFTTKELKPKEGRVFDIDMRGILYDVPDEYQEMIDAISFRDTKNQTELPTEFVSVFSREDERYNELSFVRSLEEPIDEEKIKNLYSKNAIGFLAIKENLEDEDFMNYIKELINRFPNVTFKAFCFNENQRKAVEQVLDSLHISHIALRVPKSLEDIAESIEIWLNANKKLTQVDKIIAQKSNKIISISFNSVSKYFSIEEWLEKYQTYFSLVVKNIEKSKINEYEKSLVVKNIFEFLNFKAKEYDINSIKPIHGKDNFFDYYYFQFIQYILNSMQYKEYVISLFRVDDEK